MKISKETVIIGNSGWSMIKPESLGFKDFKNKFRSLIAFYASLFDAAEVNFTFYHLPKISIAKKWLFDIRPINKKFEFTVKASRIITHTHKFQGKECINAYNIIKKFALALESRIILFQSPSNFKPKEENIENMIRFFNEINRDNVLLAWEPRGDWYNNEELLKNLLKDLELIHIVDPLRNRPLYQGKERILYFRLHGFGKPIMYLWQFLDEELNEVFNIIKETPSKKAYVMFNNAKQYEDALRFKKILFNKY